MPIKGLFGNTGEFEVCPDFCKAATASSNPKLTRGSDAPPVLHSTTVHGLAMGEHYCVRLGACAGKDVYYSVPVIVRTALVEPSPPISILASPGPGIEAARATGAAACD